PKEHQHRIKWFFSDMSDEFKETEADRLVNGETWGLMTTDSFGMGMDIPDIQIVCQWRATLPSISTIWQRFGRCVRDPLTVPILSQGCLFHIASRPAGSDFSSFQKLSYTT
ncbi:hypothetical protein F5887DRAFT_910882, partial [Amanita rubescens]